MAGSVDKINKAIQAAVGQLQKLLKGHILKRLS